MIRSALRSRVLWVAVCLLFATGVHLWLWGRTELSRTVNVVEAEWTVVALIGTVYSIDFLRECRANWRALNNGEEVDRLIVERDELIGGFMLGAHLFLLSLGVVGLTSPNSSSVDPNEVRVIGAGLTMLGESLVVLLYAIREKGERIRTLLGNP